MIGKGAFGLKDFKLVESSEQGMLAQVTRAGKKKDWIVFLGWEPHPMNVKYDMVYLTGGDDYFGPNFGGATVHTNVRAGYTQECPNVGKLLANLKFELKLENEGRPDRGQGMVAGPSGGARQVAGRRHHLRRRRRVGGGEEGTGIVELTIHGRPGPAQARPHHLPRGTVTSWTGSTRLPI
jgi:hypothetical protein